MEKQRGAIRLAALSPVAARLGLACGMTLADARGLLPELAAVPHDPAADAVVLERMAQRCIVYTPGVTPDLPHGILLDITGCAHLHGGEAAMVEQVVALFGRHGLTVATAFATTPAAARALARHGGTDVHALPLQALEVAETAHTALSRAGFRTIGELAQLPSAVLAARFGPHLVELLAGLLEQEDRRIVAQKPPADIRAEMRFPEPIGRHDDVLDAIDWLAAQAGEQLAAVGQGGRAFAVRLYRSDGHVAQLVVETGAPTRDPALLMRLFNERIDSLSDPLDPGFGYDSLTLDVLRAEPLAAQQHSLVERPGAQGDIGLLLDRLAVRYGPAAIVRFAAGNSHVPERAGYTVPVQGRQPKGDTPFPLADAQEPPLRPLVLFDPPQPVEVLAAIPDGPPRRFRWRGEQHLVRRYEGPERVAPEWWRRRQGYAAPGFSRDYYRVEDEQGRRFWLLRHGLYGRETDGPRWYVHGLFA